MTEYADVMPGDRLVMDGPGGPVGGRVVSKHWHGRNELTCFVMDWDDNGYKKVRMHGVLQLLKDGGLRRETTE